MKKVKILQFRFSNDAIDRLDRLKEASESATRSETVRKALRLYGAITKYTNDGFELQIRRNQEVIKVVTI